ncbi:MAG: proton-conducting transporter membrane subunit [Pirellulaceae bacterium]|nr:proton-conducting transporter membrane subunit [Pirellulaceae bacterium]
MPVTHADACLVWPIVAPLATALAAFVLGGRWSTRLGVAVVPIVVAATAVVTWRVWHHGPQTYSLGNWPAPLGIELHADGLSCAMLLMSACIGAVVSVYSVGYFEGSTTASRGQPQKDTGAQFWPLWLMLWSALHALFLSADIFNLYVTLELLTLAAIGLVVLTGTRAAVEAALRYLLAALAGSLLYLAGVALMYGAHGTLDIASLGRSVTADASLQAALLLMMVGLMLKTALFPLHFWLPPAHGSAPAPVSALLSGLVVKGSFYILLRLWFDVFPQEFTRPLTLLPAVLGAAAILWGSMQALVADRLKMLVAYSTVAQLGYLFLVFGLARPGSDTGFAAWSAVVLFALSHACAKGALFLAAGTILHVAGHDRIRDLPAVSRRLPTTFFAIGVASVGLMGLPPTAAFVAKWTLLRVALGGGHIGLAVVIVLGGLLAAAYLFRVLAAAFTQPGVVDTNVSYRKVPRWMEYSTLGLALVSLLLGLASYPVIELLRIGSPWSPPIVQEAAP